MEYAGPPFWQSVGITLLVGICCCVLVIMKSTRKPWPSSLLLHKMTKKPTPQPFFAAFPSRIQLQIVSTTYEVSVSLWCASAFSLEKKWAANNPIYLVELFIALLLLFRISHHLIPKCFTANVNTNLNELYVLIPTGFTYETFHIWTAQNHKDKDTLVGECWLITTSISRVHSCITVNHFLDR